MSREFWNERYRRHSSVYGSEPNEFLRSELARLKPGRILFPAEGEGRNALFAAREGWHVTAFDYSEAAASKALAVAGAAGLALAYTVDEIGCIDPGDSVYDAIALVYVHLPEPLRSRFHRQCVRALKPGGTLILEAFTTDQLAYNSGGPQDVALLYSPEELFGDFEDLKILTYDNCVVTLNEGPFHKGPAAVIRLSGRKIQ